MGLISIARNNTSPDTTAYAYDGFDRLGSTTYPNGGAGATSESLIAFGHDSKIGLYERPRG